MNAGSIDLAGVGDAPPIFAQAANTDFVYVSATVSSVAGKDKVADVFHQLEIIPRALDVTAVTLAPKNYSKVFPKGS